MYDGSNAAISPSVWPWNLPNATSSSSASSSVGGSRTACPARRPRSIGPEGCEARSSGAERSQRSGGWPVSGHPHARRGRRLVPGPDGPAEVQAAGDGSRGPRGRRSAGPARRAGRTARVIGAAHPGRPQRVVAATRAPPVARGRPAPRPGTPAAVALALAGLAGTGQRRVRGIDLGHARRGAPGRLRVVPGEVRVVPPGEAAPGGLDLVGGGAGLHAEHDVRVLGGHVESVARASLDIPRGSGSPVPMPPTIPRAPRRPRRRARRPAASPLAYRFALVYRVRAGYPRRHPPAWTPDALGLGLRGRSTSRPTDGLRLPGWFIPAGPGPGARRRAVHGWESARDRTLPHAQVLHAAGFHVLTFDVRGHGANGPETLPISVGEFAADARAGVAAHPAPPGGLAASALLGHSMGAAGALVAAAEDPDVAAVIAVAAPGGPVPPHPPDVPPRRACRSRARSPGRSPG